MRDQDAIPEPIVERPTRRQTVELCGERCEGLRCTLIKGHPGMHESVALRGRIRW